MLHPDNERKRRPTFVLCLIHHKKAIKRGLLHEQHITDTRCRLSLLFYPKHFGVSKAPRKYHGNLQFDPEQKSFFTDIFCFSIRSDRL
jgi:hypothetical protein